MNQIIKPLYLTLLAVLLAILPTGCATKMTLPMRASHGGFLEASDYDALQQEAQKEQITFLANSYTKKAVAAGDGPTPALVYAIYKPIDLSAKPSLSVADLVLPPGVTNSMAKDIPKAIIDRLRKKGLFSEVRSGESAEGLTLRGAIVGRRSADGFDLIWNGMGQERLDLEFKIENAGAKAGSAQLHLSHTVGWTIWAIGSAVEGGFDSLAAKRVEEMFENVSYGLSGGTRKNQASPEILFTTDFYDPSASSPKPPPAGKAK